MQILLLQKVFNENYYDDDDADTKPVFPEDEELQGTAGNRRTLTRRRSLIVIYDSRNNARYSWIYYTLQIQTTITDFAHTACI